MYTHIVRQPNAKELKEDNMTTGSVNPHVIQLPFVAQRRIQKCDQLNSEPKR